MKVMVRKNPVGILCLYVAKKDLEEQVVAMELPDGWGGTVTLANGWQFLLPPLPASTPLPITVEARRIGGD